MLTIKGVTAVVNLRQDKHEKKNFIVTLLHSNKLIQGTVTLPIDSDRKDFLKADLDFYETLVFNNL